MEVSGLVINPKDKSVRSEVERHTGSDKGTMDLARTVMFTGCTASVEWIQPPS